MSDSEKYTADVILPRYHEVCERIEKAMQRRDDDGEVRLIAVSKTHPAEAIRVLYDAGVRHFGESYVQEWRDKAKSLPDDIKWHFVGRLQSNKAKYIADDVAMVHSVDRRSVMKALNKRSEAPTNILLQVNLGLQDSKGGVAADKLEDLMTMSTEYPRLRVCGLMGMPPYNDDPEDNRQYFRTLRQALSRLQDFVEINYPARREILTELSIGMSQDFEVAIEEGATIIRIGTTLFGKRDYDE